MSPDRAGMIAHSLRVDRTPDGAIDAVSFTCLVPAGTGCRLYPSCDCESATAEHANHLAEPQDTCSLVDWAHIFDLDDLLDLGELRFANTLITASEAPDAIVSGPVEIWRSYDGISWLQDVPTLTPSV